MALSRCGDGFSRYRAGFVVEDLPRDTQMVRVRGMMQNPSALLRKSHW
jgi:hypothetical protein